MEKSVAIESWHTKLLVMAIPYSKSYVSHENLLLNIGSLFSIFISGEGIHGEKKKARDKEREEKEEKQNDPGGGFMGEPVM